MKSIINHEMTRAKCTTQWLFLLAGIGITPALMAQQNAVTLDHTQSSSTLNMGYHQLPPSSFTNHNGKVTGYTITVYNMTADRSHQYLKLNNLTAYYTPMNFAECFSALNSRKIGMGRGTNTSASERAVSVSFSENCYTAKTRIISLRKNNIRPVSDLKGRTMGLIESSKDLLEFNKVNREQHLSTSTTTSTTTKDALRKMAHGESAVFFIDDILAWPLINHNGQPGLFGVSSENIGNDMHHAIMMRENDQQFVTSVDNTLEDSFTSPTNVQLRKKWLPSWSCEELENPSLGSCQHSH